MKETEPVYSSMYDCGNKGLHNQDILPSTKIVKYQVNGRLVNEEAPEKIKIVYII